MAIDFEIPKEAKEVRERVRKWVHEECIPAEKKITDKETYKTTLAGLRKKAREKGLALLAKHQVPPLPTEVKRELDAIVKSADNELAKKT